MRPLTLAEVENIVEVNQGSEQIKPYLKKFIKLKLKDSKKMVEELESLNNHKIKKADIIKVVDFLPEDASDLNKIFVEFNLDEDEIKQILEIVKKYK